MYSLQTARMELPALLQRLIRSEVLAGPSGALLLHNAIYSAPRIQCQPMAPLSTLTGYLHDTHRQGICTSPGLGPSGGSLVPAVQGARHVHKVAASSRSFASAAPAAAEPEAAASEDVQMTDAAVERLESLLAESPGSSETALRLTVEAGGCSGFSYHFALDKGPNEDDRVFEHKGAKLVIDSVSYEFVRGATVDFADELIKATFEVVGNPNASGSCGCGSSFAPKDI